MSLNVELLERSFDQVKPQAAAFASSFYATLFSDYPAAQPLFANTNMELQQRHLVDALVLVVDNLRNPEALTEVLKQLGSRHVSYGTLEAHYPLVGSTLLKTFEAFLGSEWTPEVKTAWTDAYGAITQIMLQGAAA